MGARPAHLSTEVAEGFQDEQVVAVYHQRPPYPAEAIELLLELAAGGPVLDLGCGPGDLARRIAPHVERVDAVDFSEAMVVRGKQLPGGDRANLHWQVGPAEEAELHPPYALATAGESLHWMDWDVVLPRLGTTLAIVDRDWGGSPVTVEALLPLWRQYSSVKNFARYDLIEELTKRGLFTLEGERKCAPEPWRPTVEEYLDARHSQRGFSRTHMGDEAAAAFDQAVTAALEKLIASGDLATTGDRLELEAGAKVSWGSPSAAR
ncbi:class I SAM-dependent methyltransferase [Tenggerimyces flavus]|uniref:Class I SAM-dependent methyltransferase n=1 Tax=Tenggerimyces flavus TaxID=1708749 RepID=A0ABV7YBF4_9ACTN|nr:class I SAM-dependent methyltransferase [Tenggerimyces flavus]MBM7783650.1 SAM-dependent methyltransferase [Tenggerimyces flavus]